MKARKKPVVVDVYKIENEGFLLDAPEWVADACIDNVIHGYAEDFNKGVRVETLEGTMFVPFGSYLIKGVMDEIYGCEPNVFDMTYDILEEAAE